MTFIQQLLHDLLFSVSLLIGKDCIQVVTIGARYPPLFSLSIDAAGDCEFVKASI